MLPLKLIKFAFCCCELGQQGPTHLCKPTCESQESGSLGAETGLFILFVIFQQCFGHSIQDLGFIGIHCYVLQLIYRAIQSDLALSGLRNTSLPEYCLQFSTANLFVPGAIQRPLVTLPSVYWLTRISGPTALLYLNRASSSQNRPYPTNCF